MTGTPGRANADLRLAVGYFPRARGGHEANGSVSSTSNFRSENDLREWRTCASKTNDRPANYLVGPHKAADIEDRGETCGLICHNNWEFTSAASFSALFSAD